MTAASPGGGGNRRVLRIGKYEVQSYIATGGMGAVYRAVDVDLGRTVALKILQPELARKPKIVERFRREARSAARLNHENIVTVYEFAEVNGAYLLALEYIEGTDLHEYVARHGKRPPEEAARIVMQAARALAHAHGQGIVHRDIKPSNFLLTRKDGQQHLKLTDFGLARAVGEEELAVAAPRPRTGPADYLARLTTLGSTVGTVDFMSPEQARDSGSADARSDIYSLGCTLFFMLAGECPFPGGTPTERLLKHVELPVPDIRSRNPEVPAGLAAVLERMLAKNPADRYQKPQELLHDLENLDQLNGLRPPPPVAIPVAASPATTAPVAAPAPTLFADKTPSQGELVLPRKLKQEPQRGEPRRRKRHAHKRKVERAGGWRWGLAAFLAVGLTGGVVLLLTQMRPSHREDDQPKAEQTAPQRRPKPPPTQASAKGKGDRKELPHLYTPSRPLDLDTLRDEYGGALAGMTTPIVGKVYRVSRTPLGKADTFATLEDALARAAPREPTIIEIHDNGPLFVRSMPPLQDRNLVIRPGLGFRPLLAWDSGDMAVMPGSEPGRSSRWFALEGGSLALEDLDVVCKTSSPASTDTPVLFQVKGGTLSAWKCSFSTTASDRSGTVLVQLGPAATPSNCRLRRCYGRGANLTAVNIEGSGSGNAEALLEDSLLVGNEQPLLRVSAGGDTWSTLRVVRSTLVTGKALLQIDQGPGGNNSPQVSWRAWDSLLARGRLQVPGDLVVLGDAVHADKITWRVVNCLYAGWQNLLSHKGSYVKGTDLEQLHTRWSYAEGDKALAQAWPDLATAPLLAQIPAIDFQTAGTAASWAATGHDGPLGSNLSLVAPGQAPWLRRTYEPLDFPPLPVLHEGPARADAGVAGPYEGEQLDVSKVDLGKHLETVISRRGAASRVVMELFGKAKSSSPIRVRRFDLVLRFTGSGPKNEIPLLVPNTLHSRKAEALIDVEDGSLEINGVRLSLASLRPATLPNHLIRVRGGDLRLSACRLTGPLGPDTGAFQSLIAFQGAGDEANEELRTCAISECLLQTNKEVFKISGTGARVQLRQSALIAGGDVLRFQFGPTPTPRLNVQCFLEHNSVALRRALLNVPDAAGVPLVTMPVLVRAEANVFLDPFSEMPRQASLLRFEGTAISRGVLLWQGKDNGYDQRLHAFAVRADGLEEVPSLKVWTRLWGTPGEQQPLRLEWPTGPAWTFPLETPFPARLTLPPTMTTHLGNLRPGADLAALGFEKK
jgi:serine/threonine-protein kinase